MKYTFLCYLAVAFTSPAATLSTPSVVVTAIPCFGLSNICFARLFICENALLIEFNWHSLRATAGWSFWLFAAGIK